MSDHSASIVGIGLLSWLGCSGCLQVVIVSASCRSAHFHDAAVAQADIFAPGPHLLAPLDLFIAQWVESTDLQQKQLAKLLSNGPITIATVGVVVTTLAAGIQRPLLTIQRISTALAVWTFPGAHTQTNICHSTAAYRGRSGQQAYAG